MTGDLTRPAAPFAARRIVFRGSGGAPFSALVTPTLVWLAVCLPPGLWTRQADAGSVEFDFDEVASCRVLGPDEIEFLETGTKIVELQLRFSARLRDLQPRYVDEFAIEVVATDKRARVFDYEPRTMLHSDIVGEIKTTSTTEHGRNFGVTLGGSLPLPAGDLIAQVTPSANASDQRHNVQSETATRLPAKDAVIVSGTTHRGRGVFFKIRRSPQFTVEGEHTVRIRLAVPTGWRVGQLRVNCRADGQEKWLWFTRDRQWGCAEGTVRLYLAGDPRAKLQAEHPRDRRRRGGSRAEKAEAALAPASIPPSASAGDKNTAASRRPKPEVRRARGGQDDAAAASPAAG